AQSGLCLPGEPEHAVPAGGMGRGPTGEPGGPVAPPHVPPPEAEAVVGFGSAGRPDGVISRPQVVDADVATDRDVAEQLEPGSAGDPLVNPNGLLELLMVRREAVALLVGLGGMMIDHV